MVAWSSWRSRCSGSVLTLHLHAHAAAAEALSDADQFHRRAACATRTPPSSNQVLRTCVHCGLCTATCPTFLLLGDELDSPRGRIYLIKDMLETGRPATEEVVRHVDRCLSCLACMTTCPSGVNYMHLVDHARTYIEHTYRRPLAERAAARACWAWCCRGPALFRAGPAGARLARPLGRGSSPASRMLAQRLRAMLALAPAHVPAPGADRTARACIRAQGTRKRPRRAAGRLRPAGARAAINEATIRLLTRLGVEVVVAEGAGCCGALNHHMGQHDRAMALRAGQYRGLEPRDRRRRAGRGRHQRLRLRHHGEGLRLHVPHRAGAMARAGRERSRRWPCDITEFLDALRLRADAGGAGPDGRLPFRLQPAAWPADHRRAEGAAARGRLPRGGAGGSRIICCGSAGTYNLLQPEIADAAARAQAGQPRARPSRT